MAEHDTYRDVLEAYADLWTESGLPPDFEALAESTNRTPDALLEAFHDPSEIPPRYFADVVARCSEVSSDVDAGSFEEEVGAFAFILLDLLEERRAFAESFFDRVAAGWGSPFRAALTAEHERLLSSDRVPGINETVLALPPASFLATETVTRVLSAWLADTSENRERSTALVDRLVRFYSALAENPTATLAVDALKYAAEVGYLPEVPFVTEWLFGDSVNEGGPDRNAGEPGASDG